ncbi:MAG: hypothetical protein ACE5F1_20975 [Planctomycetota bacterium]
MRYAVSWHRLRSLAFLVLAGACVSPQPEKSEFDLLLEQRASYVREFRRDRARYELRPTKRRRQYFPGQGTVSVLDSWLEGLKDEEYVRLRFMYENTTEQVFEAVRIGVTVRDGGGRILSRESMELSIPFGFPFSPGSTYIDEFRVPTRGAHRESGWDWSLSCVASPSAHPD